MSHTNHGISYGLLLSSCCGAFESDRPSQPRIVPALMEASAPRREVRGHTRNKAGALEGEPSGVYVLIRDRAKRLDAKMRQGGRCAVRRVEAGWKKLEIPQKFGRFGAIGD